jgi:hypothetical protein
MAFLAQLILGGLMVYLFFASLGHLVRAGSDRALAADWDGQQRKAVRGFERVCKPTCAPWRLGARFI